VTCQKAVTVGNRQKKILLKSVSIWVLCAITMADRCEQVLASAPLYSLFIYRNLLLQSRVNYRH